ncbi:MAG: hypothetical protein V7603_140 [Micromonosporaceae bacterium]
MDTASQRDGGLPEAVLRAAGRIGEVGSAYDADLLLSTLIGGVYQALPPDRGPALDAFVDTLREHLASSTDPNAPLVAAALDGRSQTVRATGGYAYGDRYGDQTSYLATFAYDEPERGGPEHAVVVLADHNAGLAEDVLVLAPAGPVLDQLRSSLLTDPDAMTWLTEVPLATVRTAAHAYLRATDLAAQLPASEGLPANRWLALSRLALLPEPADEPEPAAPAADRNIAEEFLAAPEAALAGLAGSGGSRGESVNYCLGLIVDFATSRGGDPLRWSPQSVTTFLTDWIHQRAVLDNVDVATLPGTLAAWVVWAGRRLDLPDHAVQSTFRQVNADRDEFVRLYATGERRSPAAEAMARLVAEGVDLTDEAAVDAWLRAYNAEHG